MLEAAEIQARVDSFISTCRKGGFSVTPQRLALYRELIGTDTHPSPEELFERVRPQMPTLSLATVYKAVDTFRALGVVQDVSPLHNKMRLDANLDPHHHLVCVACKKVVDLASESLDRVAAEVPVGQQHGFKVFGHSLQFSGLCPACQEPAHAESPVQTPPVVC